MRRIRHSVGWGIAVVLPLATLCLLLARNVSDPTWQNAKAPFAIVSFTALVALLLALLMVRAATQIQDTRILFLALGFLAIAGIFLVHALTTATALARPFDFLDNPTLGTIVTVTTLALFAVVIARYSLIYSASHHRSSRRSCSEASSSSRARFRWSLPQSGMRAGGSITC